MQDKCVLVVDAQPLVLNAVSLKLRKSGFCVMTASDGADALVLAQRRRPDLLIADMDTPGLSGAQLYHRLNADDQSIMVPTILLTNRNATPGLALETANSLCRSLPKPFSLRHLLETVDALLGQVA